MTRQSRRAAMLAGIVAGASILSGCFVIPLADNRSPFDDPFGPSHADVEAVLPDVQAALDGIDADAFELTAELGSDNCEGPCDLGPRVWVEPTVEGEGDVAVPTELIARILDAAIPPAEGMPLRVDGARVQLDGATEIIDSLDVVRYDGSLKVDEEHVDAVLEAARSFLADS